MGKNSRGTEEIRANRSCDALLKNVQLTEAMSRTVSSEVASKVPIPVLPDRTRGVAKNLLTGRTVLVQRHFSWRAKNEYRCCAGRYRGAERFQSRRHLSQSFLVAVSMDFAALWSQRPRRVAMSCLILPMAWGVLKCILAVSQPME
jgi:hypothetical protein